MSIHQARAVPFDELLERLTEEQQAGRVFVKRDGCLALFGYTNACTYDRAWNKWNIIARGLVLDVERRYVVATPFPKFFNFGEQREPIEGVPHLTAEAMLGETDMEVSEKIDGSLGIAFCYKGEWRVVTRGAFASDQARWATEWLRTNVDTLADMDADSTYLFEIVYDANRIVTRYDFQGLVLLAGYYGDGSEFGSDAIVAHADLMGVRYAPRVPKSTVAELLDFAKRLPSQQEGFVVRFRSGLRIKIKGDEYCRIHKLISRVTPLAVWEAMAAGDNIEALRQDLPEEFRADFGRIVNILDDKYAAVVSATAERHAATSHLSDKELGMTQTDTKFLFLARKKNFFVDVCSPGRTRQAVFNTFRPNGNILEGYEPSTAMNRFQEEG